MLEKYSPHRRPVCGWHRIQSYSAGPKLVFYRCAGRGLFLKAAKARGLSAQSKTFRPPPPMRRRLRAKVHCGPLETIEASQGGYDPRHKNHVPDHIPYPLDALRRSV